MITRNQPTDKPEAALKIFGIIFTSGKIVHFPAHVCVLSSDSGGVHEFYVSGQLSAILEEKHTVAIFCEG